MKKIYNKILQISGNVIVLSATGIRYGELALIKSKSRDSLAEVIRIDDDLVYLQVFRGVVEFLPEMRSAFWENRWRYLSQIIFLEGFLTGQEDRVMADQC